MGNLSYMNHPPLKAPMVDVYDLTNLLRQLDFKVVSLLDLTEAEMRNAVDEFLLLLHKGVYGMDGYRYTVYRDTVYRDTVYRDTVYRDTVRLYVEPSSGFEPQCFTLPARYPVTESSRTLEDS